MLKISFSTPLSGVFLLLLLLATSTSAQTLTLDSAAQLGFAESLDSQGAYAEAAREYTRFLYFFPEDPKAERARFARALAWYRGEEYVRAEKAFESFRLDNPKSPLSLSSGIMEAQCRTKQGDPASGVILLTNLAREEKNNPEALARIEKRMAWTRLEMGDLPRTEMIFEGLAAKKPGACGYPQVLNSLNRFKSLPEKSPTLAGSLAVIPGGGYLYLGRYQDALVAFFMNAALGLAAAESFDDENHALGAIISFVGFGFYAGNIHGSYNGARKANQLTRESLWRDMLIIGAELEKRGEATCLGLTLTISLD